MCDFAEGISDAIVLAFCALLALEFIHITAADGKLVAVNASEITAIRVPRATDNFVAGAKCLVFLTDGRFISASDSCEKILAMIGRGKP